jgi:hypothetical protein|tara:strand:- start:1492 stop:1620 length:129 start_codon:yes stop_codon:yes gene_type:complete
MAVQLGLDAFSPAIAREIGWKVMAQSLPAREDLHVAGAAAKR